MKVSLSKPSYKPDFNNKKCLHRRYYWMHFMKSYFKLLVELIGSDIRFNIIFKQR